MTNIIEKLLAKNIKNLVFIGEAGSGKSEIAINFSKFLAQIGSREVDFFDLDMTKPLFRSRELEEEFKNHGVNLHFQEQFMDAPTIVGGIRRNLRNKDNLVVLDVGGDHIGARSIGAFEELLNKEDTQVFYVINSFRPWSMDFDNINHTFAQIMGVSHLDPENIKIINNPNLGEETTLEDYYKGTQILKEMISQYKDISFSCAREQVYGQLSPKEQSDVLKLTLHISLENII